MGEYLVGGDGRPEDQFARGGRGGEVLGFGEVAILVVALAHWFASHSSKAVTWSGVIGAA